MVDLTVSIVNTNNRELLRGCLRSVFESTDRISLEVYVVDNASDDGSIQMVNAKFPQVKLIENKRRLGFAENHNQVLWKSQGRYVCILNEDTLIHPNALEKMVDFMDKHHDVGAIGPQVLNDDGITVQLECARDFPTLWTEFCRITALSKLFPQSKFLGGVLMSYWDHGDTREVDCLLGACMIVRREILNEVGLLDEQFFMYGEDVDWPYRIKKQGWKICFLAEARILHYGGQSKKGRTWEMTFDLRRGEFKFFRKHYGRLTCYILQVMEVCGYLFRGLVWVTLYLLGKGGGRGEMARKVDMAWQIIKMSCDLSQQFERSFI